MTKACDQDGCPITNNMDITRSTPAEKKATAAALYATGTWTMERIAEKFGESKQRISEWLVNCPKNGQLKHAKTDSNPKGAGRPRGKTKPPKRHAKADQVAALDGTAPRKEIAAAAGVSERTARRIAEQERLRREGEVEIDPTSLSKTAQQKLEIALRQQARRLEIEFERRVSAEVDKRLKFALPHLKEKQALADKISASYTPRFSKKECQDVARCLHPDAWQSLKLSRELCDRLNTAFIIFTKMQDFLCIERDRVKAR